MRILIIDDHALFREGLTLLIGQLEPNARLLNVASVELALTNYVDESFDLILLDWNLQGLSGLDAIQAIQKGLNAAGRVVILSAEKDSSLIRKCIEEGASGYIHKDLSPALLISALKLIINGGIYLPHDAFFDTALPSVKKSFIGKKNLLELYPTLTDRQIEVLKCLVKGMSNKLIAREASITEETVKSHLTAIYKILNVQSRTQAIYFLAQQNITI